MAEDLKVRVEKFNGQNYPLWKMQMEDYLYQKDLYLPLGGKAAKPTAMKDEQWNLLDRKGTGYHTAVPGSVGGFQYLKGKDNRRCDDGIG